MRHYETRNVAGDVQKGRLRRWGAWFSVSRRPGCDYGGQAVGNAPPSLTIESMAHKSPYVA